MRILFPFACLLFLSACVAIAGTVDSNTFQSTFGTQIDLYSNRYTSMQNPLVYASLTSSNQTASYGNGNFQTVTNFSFASVAGMSASVTNGTITTTTPGYYSISYAVNCIDHSAHGATFHAGVFTNNVLCGIANQNQGDESVLAQAGEPVLTSSPIILFLPTGTVLSLQVSEDNPTWQPDFVSFSVVLQ